MGYIAPTFVKESKVTLHNFAMLDKRMRILSNFDICLNKKITITLR